ncbi:MAG: VOC family protein [Hyphomonadaceae bacterium]|nr:VOC family protein [Hyphomonadaceae bacterium]MBP9233748.1 VOC family protein [Hyphomonadaceae bacterium]
MTHPKIDYVEFSSPALGASRDFFAKAFGWSFQDYGPTYAAMTNAGVDGGIQGDAAEANTAPLVILKADDLEAVETAVKAAGGVVVRPIFAFPGGRRFHFREPGGNELAVWSEK